MKCCFAHSGTYGHECGAPAELVAVKKCDSTKNGFFYAGRCKPCSEIKGGENSDIIRLETIDNQIHKNIWK